jgi:hypothetical protein
LLEWHTAKKAKKSTKVPNVRCQMMCQRITT